MLPKFLTHSNTKMVTRHQRRLCYTFPVVLTSLLLLVLQQSIVSSAEKDFNFNDSQVPLIEPKDEQTILIDTHHLSSTIHEESSLHHIQHHHNKQQHHLQKPLAHHQQQQHHHEVHEQEPYAVELSHCRYGDNEIVLSLVLKSYNWHDFNESRKAKVLEKLSKFFAIPKEFITMESVTKHELYEMQKVALKKGNNKCHNNNRKLGRVNFIIGCGSKYFTVSEPLTKQIGEQFKNGALDNITGEKFGWWIIWNKQYKTRAQRNRRQIEGSGDDDEDEEYDYDDDYIDEPATPTTTTASSHAHRHHHGDEADETTVEPEYTLDSKVSSTTSQSMEESSASITSTSATVTSTSTATSTSPTPISEIQISSTTALPDYVESKVENTPPMIKNRINKFAVTAGKIFRYSVPKDTFYDSEDLSNLRLDLTNDNGQELKSNSWLQFDAEAREIYGLPLEDAVSKWSYRLTATDSGNESVTEIVEISVQQHRYVRSVNHEINIAVKINEKTMHFIDWPLKLIEAIAKTLDDADTNAVVVREIRTSPQDPNTATLVFFNETFPNNVCPERVELTNLVKRLDVSRLNDLVQPTLGIKQLTGQLIGNCKETSDIKPKTPTIKNVNPVPRNQIDRINATMGHLLVYKVPSDTFFDSNDNKLTLSLKTKDHKELNPRHWLQFDAKNEEFYGIPKSGDIGDEEYQLVAEDAGGLTANDALVVVVYPAPKKDFSVYIKFYLAIRHELFNADLQRKFVERVADLFGDATTQNVQIRSINPHHDFDGTIVNIYNTTLFKSHNRCPEEEIEMLRNVYLHDDTVRERVKKTLGSELNVTKVQVITAASCNAQTDVTHREFIPTKTEEPLLKSTFSEDYLYTIILPAIIIIAMILIALIVACCLHRRRRKSGKMELGDEEERKSFRTKGIPVIFQDELDEKPEIGNKSPIILKDEKPPLLPPSYNTSNMNGDNDVDEYVPPPAVVVGGREARGKSPATPSYRKPPPYVSP